MSSDSDDSDKPPFTREEVRHWARINIEDIIYSSPEAYQSTLWQLQKVCDDLRDEAFTPKCPHRFIPLPQDVNYHNFMPYMDKLENSQHKFGYGNWDPMYKGMRLGYDGARHEIWLKPDRTQFLSYLQNDLVPLFQQKLQPFADKLDATVHMRYRGFVRLSNPSHPASEFQTDCLSLQCSSDPSRAQHFYRTPPLVIEYTEGQDIHGFMKILEKYTTQSEGQVAYALGIMTDFDGEGGCAAILAQLLPTEPLSTEFTIVTTDMLSPDDSTGNAPSLAIDPREFFSEALTDDTVEKLGQEKLVLLDIHELKDCIEKRRRECAEEEERWREREEKRKLAGPRFKIKYKYELHYKWIDELKAKNEGKEVVSTEGDSDSGELIGTVTMAAKEEKD